MVFENCFQNVAKNAQIDWILIILKSMLQYSFGLIWVNIDQFRQAQVNSWIFLKIICFEKMSLHY